MLCLSVGSIECANDPTWHEDVIPSLVDQLWALAVPKEGVISSLILGATEENPKFHVVVVALWQFVAKHMSYDSEQRAAAEQYDHPLALGGLHSEDVEKHKLAEAARTTEALLNDPALTKVPFVPLS